LGALADTFDQTPDKSRFPNYEVHTGACEPLVRLGPNYEVLPWLATSYEYMGDNTFRFNLREGVTFHDGTPFTAEAVQWTFERNVRGENVGSTFIGEGSVKIVDDYTVDITPQKPNLRLPEQIVHPTWAIFAAGTEPTEKVVCTGPWQVDGYTYREEILLSRYDSYWGDPAQLEKITFRFYPDDTTRLLALEAGDVDFMMNLPSEEVSRVSEIPGLKVVTAPVGRTMLMYLNIHGTGPHTLLQDINLRRALGMAIDRDTLVNVVMEENATTDQLMSPPSVLGEYADLVQGFSYDLDTAASLLEESGWVDSDGDGIREKDGQRLTLKMIGLPEIPLTHFEFIQANLADIGMEVNITTAPDRPSYEEILNAGEFDIDLEGPNQNDGNPIFLPALRFYSKGTGKNIKFFAPGEKFDALVDEAAASPDLELVRRNSALGMQLLIDEEAIVIPVASQFRIYGLNANVEGFTPHASWANQWYDTLFFKRGE
jgi:peptide/nickel transport system substrate-binding protein